MQLLGGTPLRAQAHRWFAHLRFQEICQRRTLADLNRFLYWKESNSFRRLGNIFQERSEPRSLRWIERLWAVGSTRFSQQANEEARGWGKDPWKHNSLCPIVLINLEKHRWQKDCIGSRNPHWKVSNWKRTTGTDTWDQERRYKGQDSGVQSFQCKVRCQRHAQSRLENKSVSWTVVGVEERWRG